jgi:hypothetical protein
MKWILIKVRLHQLRRQLDELGIGYTFILLALSGALIFYVYLAYTQKEKSFSIFIVLVLTLLSIQISRRDKDFVFNQLDHPVQNIFGEYFIFTLPVTIPSLFTSHWFYFPLIILSSYFIANIKTNLKQRTVFPQLSKILSSQNFEWLSGIRKNYIGFFIFLLLAYITCWIRILPLVFLWLITTAVASFYQECESLQILFAPSVSPKNLLKKKILKSIKFLAMMFIPILILNSIFNPEFILINIIFLLIQITILIFAILLKYTTYTPNENLKGNTVVLSMVSIGSLIPFLFPIPLIMCFRNYSKAIKNLNFYFND